jgi:hypothetical protein
MKKIYLTLTYLSLVTISFAQKQGVELDNVLNTANEKKLVKESTDQMMAGYYPNANKVVDKLLGINANSFNYNYRKGYTYFMLSKNPKEVISYLSKATGKVKKSIDVYSTKNVAPSDVYYYLGNSYQTLEKLDSAEYFYTLFNEKSSKGSVLYRYSQLRLKQSGLAKNKVQNPNKDILVTNLGPNVNTNYPEYSSVSSPDAYDIYFTSRRPWGGDTSLKFISAEEGLYPEDIYMSSGEGSSWSKPTRLKSNSPMYNEATVTLNNNKFYTYTDSTGRGDIYSSNYKEAFHFPEQLLDVTDLNTKKSWETSVFFSQDGNRIYFSSDRKGGYGGRDLYTSVKGTDGKWAAPQNMGPAVNTAYDEESPFVSNNGKYFFYASNNEQSIGGFDIFYAPITNGSVGTGKPLDYPLNSTADDVFYTSSGNGYKGYLTSSRNGSYGDKDIYEIDMNYIGLEKVRFAVVALKTLDNVPMPESVKTRFICPTCEVKSIDVHPRKDGKVIQSLEPCKEYYFEYLIGSEEKVMKRDTVKTDCDLAKQEIHKEYTIDVPNKKIVGLEEKTPTPTPQPIAEYKQNFGYNKNVLTAKDKKFVEAVTKAKDLLKDPNTMIVFEVYSSASTVPTKTYNTNENLAQLRANNAMLAVMKAFEKDSKLLSRIQVVVKDASVNGPAYSDDAKNVGKYDPYQFVEIKVMKK